MARKIARYGWKRDNPDHRDLKFGEVHRADLGEVPEKTSLKPSINFVFDQGELGSCTANSTMLMWELVHGPAADGGHWSRMFTYIESLIYEHSYPQDSGAQIRDVMKVLATKGTPPESEFPYVVKNFPHKPTHGVVVDARKDKIVTYSRLLNRADFLNCLAGGHPFVFGFTVYESFESDAVAKTGIVPLPGKHEEEMGGHAVCCIGYDQNFNGTSKLYYLVQNSWGENWGDPKNPGCFWMPAEFLENPELASDFWTCRNT